LQASRQLSYFLTIYTPRLDKRASNPKRISVRIFFVILLIVSSLLVASPALAQNDENEIPTPKAELYGGYYYARFNVSVNATPFPAPAGFNANGGGGQLEYNINSWAGAVADFAGYHVSTTPSVGAFSYLFGPRINFRRKRQTTMLFAHVLLGGIHANGPIGRVGNGNAFALTVGAGVDVKVSPSVAIRLAQAEYFMTRFTDGLSNRQDNFRFGAGVVFRFGHK
jgi:opacity protein-like surface antigen